MEEIETCDGKKFPKTNKGIQKAVRHQFDVLQLERLEQVSKIRGLRKAELKRLASIKKRLGVKNG